MTIKTLELLELSDSTKKFLKEIKTVLEKSPLYDSDIILVLFPDGEKAKKELITLGIGEYIKTGINNTIEEIHCRIEIDNIDYIIEFHYVFYKYNFLKSVCFSLFLEREEM